MKKKTELLVEKIAKEQEEVMKKLAVKGDIIQEDLDNDDYFFMLEEEDKKSSENEDEHLHEIAKERIKNDDNKRLTFEDLLEKVPKLRKVFEEEYKDKKDDNST